MNADQNRQTLYEILGVPREAKPTEIRAAFRDLARVYHPDSKYYEDIIHDPVRARHVALFHQILDAYHTLNSPEKRREYDLTLPKLRVHDVDAERDPSATQTINIRGSGRMSGVFDETTRAEPSVAEMLRSSRRRAKRVTMLAYAFALLALAAGLGLLIATVG